MGTYDRGSQLNAAVRELATASDARALVPSRTCPPAAEGAPARGVRAPVDHEGEHTNEHEQVLIAGKPELRPADCQPCTAPSAVAPVIRIDVCSTTSGH